MINYLLVDSLLLGVQHSFEPDHMAAVSVLATEKNQKPKDRLKLIWRSSHWALGHSLTLILFACLVLILKSNVSLDISEKVELIIGPLMIWLGIVALRRNFRKPNLAELSVNAQKVSRSFWVGMVHGLAGTGGACAVALTLAASDAYTAVWIIVIQSLGIILSMSAYGYFFAFSINKFASKRDSVLKIINYIVGAFSIIIGIMTLYEAFQG
ncbi:cytochrome c biogenesis protein CcdA [Dyadobacter diqingensis]|uniref:cytochrome c biogenesis protein CcdA n=1 Tax=Dyadobacter diqingensis TaxID=2938121 RepID=UPI0020C1A4F5|nr:cytochrome c biogenesis protein CcdA [Dyadobacter diqingensis]